MRIAFVDIETTNAEAWIGEVWEIAVVLDDDGRLVNQWSSMMAAQRLGGASGTALRVGGYYERGPGQTNYTEPEGQSLFVAARVANALADTAFASCNVAFDTSHLSNFLLNTGQAPAWHYSPIDVKSVACGARPDLLWDVEKDPEFPAFGMPSTNQIADALGIDQTEIQRGTKLDRHSALFDAHLARSIFYRALRDTQPGEAPKPEGVYGW